LIESTQKKQDAKFSVFNLANLCKDVHWTVLQKVFYSSFRYIDDVLSLNYFGFGDYLNLISPNEFEVKDTTDTQRWLHYSNCQLPFHRYQYSNITRGRRLHFTIHARYSRACAQCRDFLYRGHLLTQKLLKLGYVAPRLKSSLSRSGSPLRNIHISNENNTEQ